MTKLFRTLFQLVRCLVGRHDWVIMYQGIEGTSKDCRLCGCTREER